MLLIASIQTHTLQTYTEQLNINKLRGKTRNMPRPYTPHAAAQLQPDRQRLALGGGVDYYVDHINYVVT